MAEKNLAAKPDHLSRLAAIINDFRGQRWPLIPLLQRIQEEYGYIPAETVAPVAAALHLNPAQVQGVVSFYAQLYTTPRGRNVVKVCRGTACHVRGGKTILKLVKRQLGVEDGETTPDNEYTLETVACIGCCALAPNVVVNQSIHGHMNPRKVPVVLGWDRER